MLRYACYRRKSDDDSSLTEKSLGEQQQECKRVEERERLNVVWSKGESKSARKAGKRAVYDEMIELIKEGKVDAILCWHVNRLARNMKEGGEIVDLFVNGQIKEIRTPSSLHRTGDNILPPVIDSASAAQ